MLGILENLKRWATGSPKADAHPVSPEPEAATPPQTPAAAAPTNKACQPNPREELRQRAFKVGYKTCIESGAPKVPASMMQALDSQALGMGQAAHRPASEERTQRRIARLGALAEHFDRQTIDRDRAAVHVAAAKDKLARRGARGHYPTLSSTFRYAAVVGLSISTAPTFHDFLVGLDPTLKWLLGGLCAVGVSLLIVHGILPEPRPHNPNQPVNEVKSL